VLQAITQAAGLTPSAHDDRLFLVRQGAERSPARRVRFRYPDLLIGEPRSASFELQDGGVVVVQ
jgi:protein involved in polysaccharide export with SLBB domain